MSTTPAERSRAFRERKRRGLVRTRPVRPSPPAAVFDPLAELVTAVRLPGCRFSELAACRGGWAVFDPAAPGEAPPAVARRHARALRICGVCPVLAECRAWVDRLPAGQQPDGVIAGRLPNSGGNQNVD